VFVTLLCIWITVFELAFYLGVEDIPGAIYLLFPLLVLLYRAFFGHLRYLETFVHFHGWSLVLALDTGVGSLSKSIYPMFSSLVVLLCILCEGVGAGLLTRAYYFSAHPVLVEVEHAEYVVVLHDSAIEVYIPVLLIVYSILCILREGAGASLSTRACFLSTHPGLVGVKNAEFIVVLVDSAMTACAVLAG
jgi:hypothetical protein